VLRLVEEDAGVNVVLAQLAEGAPAGAYALERDVPFILVNSTDAPVRQRFTLAHEFGHHNLGHGSIVDREIHWDSKEPREVAANRFAAEFLAPLQAINLWFDIRGNPAPHLELLVTLANSFGISCEVALWRSKSAGRVTDSAAKVLRSRIDAHDHYGMRSLLRLVEFTDSLSQAGTLNVRVPNRMLGNVLAALEFGIIDRGQAADRLRLTTEQLESVIRRSEHNRTEE
jgi:Zn-dependent peptidase ImmA (M78 family)